MSTVTVELDVGIWLTNKGQVQLFCGDDPKPLEVASLLDLIRAEVESHKVIGLTAMDRDDAKKFVKLKKELVKCLNYLDKELSNAK